MNRDELELGALLAPAAVADWQPPADLAQALARTNGASVLAWALGEPRLARVRRRAWSVAACTVLLACGAARLTEDRRPGPLPPWLRSELVQLAGVDVATGVTR